MSPGQKDAFSDMLDFGPDHTEQPATTASQSNSDEITIRIQRIIRQLEEINARIDRLQLL